MLKEAKFAGSGAMPIDHHSDCARESGKHIGNPPDDLGRLYSDPAVKIRTFNLGSTFYSEVITYLHPVAVTLQVELDPAVAGAPRPPIENGP